MGGATDLKCQNKRQKRTGLNLVITAAAPDRALATRNNKEEQYSRPPAPPFDRRDNRRAGATLLSRHDVQNQRQRAITASIIASVLMTADRDRAVSMTRGQNCMIFSL